MTINSQQSRPLQSKVQQYQPMNIAYCSNVHPGETLAAVINNIRSSFTETKTKRQLTHMAAGLWLSAKAANTLVTSTNEMAVFKKVLSESGMLLTSLNGFPFGNFHQEVVKKSVYLPHWAQEERLQYSQNLATILADCLPEHTTFGAISTLPLAYKQDWSKSLHAKAISNLIQLSQFLQQLEHDTGKHICFGLEMEPDCVFETTTEFIAFFQKELIPAAQKLNISERQILRYIGCCYDTCHQAVLNENILQ